MTRQTKQSLVERVKKDGVKFVAVQFSDIHGCTRAGFVPFDRIEVALKSGVGFDGSSVKGYSRICESDMVLVPDESTYAVLPWVTDPEKKTARLICDVHDMEGQPSLHDPRFVLKRALEVAKGLGLTYKTGPELEFFLFKLGEDGKPIIASSGNGTYFSNDAGSPGWNMRMEIAVALSSFGIQSEMIHSEVAGSQHEVSFKYADALQTADNAMTFKMVVKAIAAKYGYHATFMPKPIAGVNGSGSHVHQSLWKGDGNIFADPSGVHGLSETARQFIAGQLEHIGWLCALLNPTVNSYKRLVPGYEAPVNACWGRTNRSALLRVPHTSNANAVRVELRVPDPTFNPYFALAAMLRAGLDGVKRKLNAPEPVDENVFEMGEQRRTENGIKIVPGSLHEAIMFLEESKLGREVLGEHLFEVYVAAKKDEWRQYLTQVSQWELRQYLEY
ncbi:MAG: glutamine synthetase family protein [Candidatus Micrarchaeota archaeon]